MNSAKPRIGVETSMTSPAKVLLLEPDRFFGSLVESSLIHKGFEVLHTLSATEASEMATSLRPRIIIGELRLKDAEDPIRLYRHLQKQSKNRGASTIFLTNVSHPRLLGYREHALPVGAQYLIKKDIKDFKTIVEAINIALGHSGTRPIRQDKLASGNFPSLTIIQLQVLELVAQGFTNQQIAEKRGTTARAVETLLSRAMQTLQLSDEPGQNGRVTMVLHYLRANGWIDH